jgi:uncharacterized protein (TIGR00297 family)
MSVRLGINGESSVRRKAISPARDRAQSRVLTWVVGAILSFAAASSVTPHLNAALSLPTLARSMAISMVFGCVVWALRAATAGGVVVGVLICFLLLQSSGGASYSALAALISLFILSFAATRFGRSRKESRGLAERHGGRQASQVVANLGVAALFASTGHYAGCIAALAEAAADTSSSEIGQALGGPVRLLTSWKVVSTGTDGGISLGGTLAGVVSAAIVVAIGGLFHLSWHQAAVSFLAACAGLLFDSLLGATVERRGWVGNDLVNFFSTAVAALLAAVTT